MQIVEKLLDNPAAVHLDGEGVHVGEDGHKDAPLLLLAPVLHKLLDDIVSEHVRHQGELGSRNLLPQPALLVLGGGLQLLLDEPGAVLVLAELDHVRLQLPQSDVRVPVVPEIGGSIVIKGEGTVALLRECHLRLSYS